MALTPTERFGALPMIVRLPLAVVALALMGLGLSACGNDDQTVLEDAEEEGTADAFVGQTITVRGEVEQVLPAGGFLIGGEFVSLGYDEGTLVYGTDLPEISDGDEVRVTGVVQEFIATDVRDAVGVDFDEEDPLVVAYEEQYAIEADSVEVIPDED